MTHVDLAVLQGHLDLGGQLQQTHIVGHRRTALAHALRDFLLRHATGLCQVLVGQCYFDGVQVLTLDILHQCQLHHALIVGRANIGRDSRETGNLRCAPTTFTGDDLVVVLADLAQGDRCNDTHGLDTCCQFLHGRLVKLTTRLVGVGLNLVDGNLVQV